MDFSLTPDQELLRDTGRKLLERECPPALVRAHIDDPSAYEPLWRHLSEYTALGPGPAADLCLFLEQTGYAAAPGPFLATTAVRRPDRRRRGHGHGRVRRRSQRTPSCSRPIGWIASRSCCPARGSRSSTPRTRPARFVATVDFSRRLFVCDLPRVEPQPIDPAVYDRWRDRAYASMAAEMVGTARRIFDMALAYAKERKQFDVPIGSFQAIQHKLADMSLALERATAAVHYAAMTIDGDDPECTRACHVAKAAAGEAARRILKDGIQIHGGIGYTWEHDLHLYLRRATGDEYLFGTTGWHLDRLAELLIDT